MMNEKGTFTISLDFELFWGIRDVKPLEKYEENIRNVPLVIPKILELFSKYDIHATWAVAGFIFFNNKEDLLANIPSRLPQYKINHLSPYNYIFKNSLPEVYHFSPKSIALIKSTPYQEIGTHTFCHYYTLEKGQTLDQFKLDIESAIKVQEAIGCKCQSIVFPRNQFNADHLQIVRSLGIKYYRGTENYWVYEPRQYRNENLGMRLVRLTDAYINISGHNTFKVKRPSQGMPMDIPSSSFLRPYNPSSSFLDGLKYNRISKSMTYAAKHGEGYHLWWHPHNFGKYSQENLIFLERILKHFKKLNSQYGFLSKSMNEY